MTISKRAAMFARMNRSAMMLTFGLVLAADQLSKMMVAARIPDGTSSTALLGIRLAHHTNRRLPWRSATAVRLMAIVLLCLAVAAWMTANILHSLGADIAIGAIVGGAAGNLIDGFTRKAVIDFIDIRVWPVFNVADAAIVAGAAWIMWDLLSFALGNGAIS